MSSGMAKYELDGVKAYASSLYQILDEDDPVRDRLIKLGQATGRVAAAMPDELDMRAVEACVTYGRELNLFLANVGFGLEQHETFAFHPPWVNSVMEYLDQWTGFLEGLAAALAQSLDMAAWLADNPPPPRNAPIPTA